MAAMAAASPHFDPKKVEELTADELQTVSRPAAPGSERDLGSPSPGVTLTAGLGIGVGGHIARNALSCAGTQLLRTPYRLQGAAQTPPEARRSVLDNDSAPNFAPLRDSARIQGLFKSLVLNEVGDVSNEELDEVRYHRWTFQGAEELASKGKNVCFFVRCLLDLQRNVQLEEDGEALEPKVVRACRLFVQAQCREGRHSEMYQMLTHFISNSKVFEEWDSYLQQAFGKTDADTESVIAPFLEQVWNRFCNFNKILQEMFKVLDLQFSWRHRLPKVEDLVNEHMKRRCFSHERTLRNELFAQEKCGNETIKEIKRAFGFNR